MNRFIISRRIIADIAGGIRKPVSIIPFWQMKDLPDPRKKFSDMKITNSVRKAITAHSDGLFVENGEVVDELSDEDQKMWDQYKKYEYFFMNQKIKE